MAASVPGQTEGAGAGSGPAPISHRSPTQVMRWQSATAARAVCAAVTVNSKSTHTTAKSGRSEEHTSELQSRQYLVCRLLLEKKDVPKSNPASLMQLSVCKDVTRAH